MRIWLKACIGLLAFFLVAAPAGLAHAAPIDDAKAAGLVGEQPDGYLGAVKPPNDATKALIQQINGERRVHYEKIAKKRGTEVAAVAALAGKKLVGKAGKGEFVRKPDGEWVQVK